MSKYYTLVLATNAPVIGNVEGGIQSYFAKDHNQEKKLLMIKPLYQLIDIEKIHAIQLDKSSIITDVISHGTLGLQGLIVSELFRNTVAQYKLLDIQFVDIEFYHRKDITGYSFMFFNSDLSHLIDYKRTEFGVKKYSSMEGKFIIEPIERSFNNLQSFKTFMKENVGRPRKIRCQNKYVFTSPLQYDIFRIGHFDKSFYFSEKVASALSKHRLTGFSLVESSYF